MDGGAKGSFISYFLGEELKHRSLFPPKISLKKSAFECLRWFIPSSPPNTGFSLEPDNHGFFDDAENDISSLEPDEDDESLFSLKRRRVSCIDDPLLGGPPKTSLKSISELKATPFSSLCENLCIFKCFTNCQILQRKTDETNENCFIRTKKGKRFKYVLVFELFRLLKFSPLACII